MSGVIPSLRKLYLKSPHHAAVALGTVGVGFMTGEPLGLIVGAAAYVLSWIYVPDLPFFKKWSEKQVEAQFATEAHKELQDFAARRDALLDELHASRQERYARFAGFTNEVASGDDPRARKLEEMLWTFLRLLSNEQSLEMFLEGERRDDVPGLLKDAEDEVKALGMEVKALAVGSPQRKTREKLYESRMSRLEVLRRRAELIEQADANLQLASAELDRLDEQVKLLRADSVAARNAGAVSERIDSTFEHLAQTNRWLAEMDQFQDAIGTPPTGGMRTSAAFKQPAAPTRRETQSEQ